MNKITTALHSGGGYRRLKVFCFNILSLLDDSYIYCLSCLSQLLVRLPKAFVKLKAFRQSEAPLTQDLVSSQMSSSILFPSKSGLSGFTFRSSASFEIADMYAYR